MEATLLEDPLYLDFCYLEALKSFSSVKNYQDFAKHLAFMVVSLVLSKLTLFTVVCERTGCFGNLQWLTIENQNDRICEVNDQFSTSWIEY